jgi:tRNA pseudouridine32 synthase/23S rRNA pseudouridine746 synthase
MTEKLSVVYEDPYLVIVDKPSGLLSVPGRTPDLQDCVWNRLKEQFPERDVFLVHRLDRDTSGLICFAFTREAQTQLGQCFEKRKVEKEYVAWVEGILESDAGVIDAPMRKDWSRHDKPVYIICPERGKQAVTRYQVEERKEGMTRVRLFPKTGRSHQLRVHMLSLGHPIVGDPIYGSGTGPGILRLRAVQLTFPHPVTGQEVDVRVEE